MKLFGSSGIRGLFNVEITPLLAQKVGAALATMFEGGAVLVGRDTRLSGKILELALTSGLVSCGFIAGTIGIVPTPVLAWLTKEMETEAGVSITASHNPPQYNGMKIFDTTGIAYTRQQQEALEDIILNEEFSFSSWSRIGKVDVMDLKALYIDAIANLVEIPISKHIACDLYNGATSSIASELFEEIGTDVKLINSYPDGNFPSGNPEPNQESLSRLGRLIKSTEAEIGFGFDGDGDRMMVVDENGKVPAPDTILAAYAKYLIEKKGGGTIVTHVGASMSVEEAVEGVGGNLIRTRVGDVHVTESMIEHEAIFGGEPVGAWIHPDIHFCPDGLLSALRLLMALEAEGESLSEFIMKIPEYPTLREKITCSNLQKETTMESVLNAEKIFGDVKEISTVDGIRFQFEDSWVLIRPSGTEPLIRITVEAHKEKRAHELMNISRRFVKDILGERT